MSEERKRYFHGTMNRLMTGDLLLPPVKTTAICCSTIDSNAYKHDRNRVYVTTDYTEACIYAVTRFTAQTNDREFVRRYAGRGFVYEVTPRGELQPDPGYTDWVDDLDDAFMSCDSALIIAEYRPSWNVVGIRCLRQMIEDQNDVSLGELSEWRMHRMLERAA